MPLMNNFCSALPLVTAQAQEALAFLQQLRAGRVSVGIVARKTIEFGIIVPGGNVDWMPGGRVSLSILVQSERLQPLK